MSNVDAANRETILDLLDELAAEASRCRLNAGHRTRPTRRDRVRARRYWHDCSRGTTRRILTDTDLLRDCDLRPPQVVSVGCEPGLSDAIFYRIGN